MSNETKHTPGPWHSNDECERYSGYFDTTVSKDDGELIAVVRSESSKEHVLANAKLIAEAPDLLEACKLAAHHIMFGKSQADIESILIKTIAHAEGRHE